MAHRRPLPLPLPQSACWRDGGGPSEGNINNRIRTSGTRPRILSGGTELLLPRVGGWHLATTGRGEALTRTNPSRKLQDLQSLQVQCVLGTIGIGHLVDPKAPRVSPSRASAHPPSFGGGVHPEAADDPRQPAPCLWFCKPWYPPKEEGASATGTMPELGNFTLKVNPLKRSPK